MTFKERLAIEHPEKIDISFCGDCCGCPSNYGYEFKITKCTPSPTNCTICWNREIPGTVKKAKADEHCEVDIHKIIDDAMVKKDRTVSVFISAIGTSIRVDPYTDDDKSRWIKNEKNGNYICRSCGRTSLGRSMFCPNCGEPTTIFEETANDT